MPWFFIFFHPWGDGKFICHKGLIIFVGALRICNGTAACGSLLQTWPLSKIMGNSKGPTLTPQCHFPPKKSGLIKKWFEEEWWLVTPEKKDSFRWSGLALLEYLPFPSWVWLIPRNSWKNSLDLGFENFKPAFLAKVAGNVTPPE